MLLNFLTSLSLCPPTITSVYTSLSTLCPDMINNAISDSIVTRRRASMVKCPFACHSVTYGNISGEVSNCQWLPCHICGVRNHPVSGNHNGEIVRHAFTHQV